MEEKRKNKRLPATMTLEISNLFKQEGHVENIEAPITITDISQGGVGFISKSDLPLDFYFNANIKLGEGENNNLYSVVKIIRKEKAEAGFKYGSELVGFAPILSYIFEDYEKSLN